MDLRTCVSRQLADDRGFLLGGIKLLNYFINYGSDEDLGILCLTKIQPLHGIKTIKPVINFYKYIYDNKRLI